MVSPGAAKPTNQPHHQQHDYNQPNHATRTPAAITAMRIIPAAAAEQQNQYKYNQNQ